MNFASLMSQYKSAPRGQKRGREDGGSNGHRAKMGRSDDRSRDRVVYLIHTPKTAGSAIKHALARTESAGRQNFGETFRVRARDGGTVRIVSNGHTEAYKFPRHGFKVACVRHPFERFASAFSFVREGGRNHPLQGAVGQAREWKGFLQRFPSLSAFLRDADAVRTITDPRRGHTHFLPLSHWICDAEGNLAADFIVRQEALDVDLGRLCDMLGIELKLSGGSGRDGKESGAGGSALAADKPVAAVPKFNCTGERHAVSDEDRPFLRHLLADDLKLFEGLMAQRPSLEAQAARKALKLFGTTHTFTHLRADQHVGSGAVALDRGRRKVFCIGGHKNGTLSLSCYFERLGYRTVHGCFWVNDNRLLETHDFFSDNFAEFESSRGRIAELARRFPDALFILNYRPSPAYVRSVYSHVVLNKFRVPRRKWNIDRCGRRDILGRIVSTHETHEHALRVFGLDGDTSPSSSSLESKRLLVINVCNGENARNKALLDNFLGLVGDDARPDVQLERVPNYEKTESIARQMARFMESDDTVDWVERELRKVVTPERYVSKLDRIYAQACADMTSTSASTS